MLFNVSIIRNPRSLNPHISIPLIESTYSLGFTSHRPTIAQIGDERFSEEPEALFLEAAPEEACKMRIEELNPTPELEKGFYLEKGFELLTEIQGMVLPPIVNPPHENVIFQSPSDSGKSTTLVLAMLFRVDPKLKYPQAICIVPNHHLAMQNMDLLLKMGKHSLITCVLGIPPSKADYKPLAKMPPVEAQVIIGTPFTIHKWIAAKKLNTRRIKVFVIDDLDRVLAEPGFKDNVLRITMDISKKRSLQYQVIMCSNISNADVEAFASEIKDKMEVPSLDNVKQYKVNVPNELSKINIIKDKILSLGEVGQTIIFVHTKESALKLCETLKHDDYKFASETLDGADAHEQRDKIIKEFKEERLQVLISTIILDQMFDQSQVDVVVFCDMSIISGSSPEPDLEQYSHCIGRAGQFGCKGAVFNLMCGDEDEMIMEKIEMHNNVTQVSWESDVEFVDALKKAGL